MPCFFCAQTLSDLAGARPPLPEGEACGWTEPQRDPSPTDPIPPRWVTVGDGQGGLQMVLFVGFVAAL